MAEDVRKAEWNEAIQNRRRQAFPKERENGGDGDPGGARDLPDDLIGLALSGGGLRSAAFNLGLVQALHRFGVLRFVDYLSSVSGGSYVGAMVSESVAKSKRYGRTDFELALKPDGTQPERVLNVTRRGNYLWRLDLSANRYVLGLLFNLLPWLCAIVCVGSGVALLWRALDFHTVRTHLGGLGLHGDVIPAFIPTVVMVFVWICLSVAASGLQSRPLKRWSNRTFWLSLLCLAISLTVLIGNGDISLNRTSTTQATDVDITWQESLRTPLMILAALGLVPMLFPRRLLRSGTAPRHPIESWVFYYTSFALFLGIPLAAIGWFARENVSGFARSRGPELVHGDVDDMVWMKRLLLPDDGAAPVRIAVPLTGRSNAQHVDFADFLLNAEAIRSDEELSKALSRMEEGVQTQRELEYRLQLPHRFPPRRPVRSPTPTQSVESTDVFDSGWPQWRYLKCIPRFAKFVEYLLWDDTNDYAQYVILNTRLLKEKQSILDRLNVHLRDNREKHHLFTSVGLIAAGGQAVQGADLKLKSNEDPTTNEIQLRTEDISPEMAELVLQAATGQLLADERERGELNRFLLEQGFPELVRPRSELRRAVLIHHDQLHRLFWLLGSAALLLIASAIVNPNATSLHDYYRDRLAVAFLKAGENQGDDPYPQMTHLPLRECRPDSAGAPYPLFVAATATRSALWRHPDQLEPGFVTFLLSPLYCGSDNVGVCETRRFADEDISVADAIAISGAALSPNYFVHHIVSALMSLLNLRLGKWLRLPETTNSPRAEGNGERSGGSKSRRISMLSLGLDEVRSVRQGTPRTINLITDGGHVENLGLEALLERECRIIIVSDAGQDPLHGYDDLARLCRRLQVDQGVRFESLDGADPLSAIADLPCVFETDDKRVEALRKLFSRDADARKHKHYFCARIRYRTGKDGLLVYLKPCLTGDEGIGIYNFALQNKQFPQEPTSDQAFSFSQFESYRELGYHAGEDVCRSWKAQTERAEQEAPESMTGTLWDTRRPFDHHEIWKGIVGADPNPQRGAPAAPEAPAGGDPPTPGADTARPGQGHDGQFNGHPAPLHAEQPVSAEQLRTLLQEAVRSPQAVHEVDRLIVKRGVQLIQVLHVLLAFADESCMFARIREVLESWPGDSVVPELCNSARDADQVVRRVARRMLRDCRFADVSLETCLDLVRMARSKTTDSILRWEIVNFCERTADDKPDYRSALTKELRPLESASFCTEAQRERVKEIRQQWEVLLPA